MNKQVTYSLGQVELTGKEAVFGLGLEYAALDIMNELELNIKRKALYELIGTAVKVHTAHAAGFVASLKGSMQKKSAKYVVDKSTVTKQWMQINLTEDEFVEQFVLYMDKVEPEWAVIMANTLEDIATPVNNKEEVTMTNVQHKEVVVEEVVPAAEQQQDVAAIVNEVLGKALTSVFDVVNTIAERQEASDNAVRQLAETLANNKAPVAPVAAPTQKEDEIVAVVDGIELTQEMIDAADLTEDQKSVLSKLTVKSLYDRQMAMFKATNAARAYKLANVVRTHGTNAVNATEAFVDKAIDKVADMAHTVNGWSANLGRGTVNKAANTIEWVGDKVESRHEKKELKLAEKEAAKQPVSAEVQAILAALNIKQ